MDTSPVIVAAWITASGAIAAALITALIPALRETLTRFIVNRSGHHKRLKGRWQCQWYRDPGVGSNEDKESELIASDAVNISVVSRDRFSASGENTEYGNYTIDGRVSPANLVTMTWYGSDPRTQHVGGVALLELNPTWEKMHGYWYEYSHFGEREFYGGRTIWQKKSS